MQINKKIILALLLVAAVGLYIYIRLNFTFGFVALFLFLMIFLLLPISFKERKTNTIESNGRKVVIPLRNKKGRPLFNRYLSAICSIMIVLYGTITLYTLGNYFNAGPNIYKNYQHHALRIDGIKIKKFPFNLAGADSNSFLDNSSISGKVWVVGIEEDSVVLQLRGTTNAIYRKYYNKNDEPYRYECLNAKNSLIQFDASTIDSGEWIILTSEEKDDLGHNRIIKFKIVEEHIDGLIRNKDSIRCVFIENDGAPQTSSFHNYIKNSYSLAGLATDVSTQFDLSGINIVRGDVSLKVKSRDLYKKYRNSHYYIEVEENATLRSVQVGNKEPVYISNVRQSSYSILKVPYEKSIYIGSGTNKSEAIRFALHGVDSTLILKYELPQYHYLTSSDAASESSLMVTSTIINPNKTWDDDSGLIDNLTDNILLFDLFNNERNTFHFSPFFISYIAGPTNELMEFSLLTENDDQANYGIKTETYLPDIKSHNGTEWLIQIENFKKTTPFKDSTLSWLLLLIIIICAFSMLLSGKKRLYTTLEYAVYLIIISFLGVRFFLLWRTTVFPPVSSVSLYEFNHFRDKTWLNIVIWCFFAYIIGINTIKYFICRYRNKSNTRISLKIHNYLYKVVKTFSNKIRLIRRSPRKKLISAISIFIFVVNVIVILFIEFVKNTPVTRVLLPAVSFFSLDAIIYGLLSATYKDDIINNEEKKYRRVSIVERASAFILSLWNMLLTSFITLIADGGYGVMFCMFMIFSLWFKVVDLFQYINYRKIINKNYKTLATVSFWLLFSILLILILFYKKIFIELFHLIFSNESWLFFVCAGGGVLLISGLIFIILNIRLKKHHVLLPILIVVVCTLGTLLSPHIKGSHMEFRTRVHMEPAGEILYNIDSPIAQEKFLQASLNDWILHQYREIGKDIKGVGEQGNGYFKLQPQSKVGAMWFAQTTDICISRYIIAEHGKRLPWLFVLAFSLLLLISMKAKNNQRWGNMLSVQVTLLFAVQSLMILLANTQAFIFFGQDFPLISITSRLSTLYFFILMFMCVGSAIIGKNDFNMEFKEEKDVEREMLVAQKNNRVCFIMLSFFLLSAGVLYVGRTDINRGNFKAKEKTSGKVSAGKRTFDLHKIAYYKDNTYDLDSLLTVINGELDDKINPFFIEYQRHNGTTVLHSDMSAYIAEVFRDSIMLDCKSNCSELTRTLLDNYIKRGSKSNSINNLICLRNTLSYSYIKQAQRTRIIPHDTLEFVTSLNYFKYEMPQKIKSSWKGSVVEITKDVLPDTSYINKVGCLTEVFIPDNLTSSGKPVQLIKNTGDIPVKIVGSDALISVNKDNICVVNLSTSDYLIDDNRTVNNTPLQRYRYIARNVLLNGKRTFVYPNGQKAFWARDIAALASRQNGPDDGNVVMNVNMDLTNSIYDSYVSNVTYGNDRTVIVADGDGLVRAMVDYRTDKRYRINPNDFKRIGYITDSLYLYREKGRYIESRFFGNFAQNSLRCGPGSSQKPILWTAVTSMYNTGWWNSLELKGIPRIPLNTHNDSFVKSNVDGSKYVFSKFAGNRIESKFRSNMGDEGNGNNVSLQYYIYKSSNYYNAVMAYLGSFTKADYDNYDFSITSRNKDGISLFFTPRIPNEPARSARQSNDEYHRSLNQYADNYYDLFPLMKVGSRTVAFNKFLSPELALDTTALVPTGLHNNFGLHLRVDKSDDHVPPYFNMAVRAGRTNVRQLNEYMVRSVAIGSNSIWNVSPSKMAEMYGRLITLNKSYTLSLFSGNDEKQYTQFDIDDSWISGYEDYQVVRKELLVGMSKVYSVGTASGMGVQNMRLDGDRVLTIDTGEGVSENSSRKLYIYGKTGTINGFWGGEKVEDHLLATIITDRELTNCTEEDLKEVKFYVIYQADYDYNKNRHSGDYNHTWQMIDRNILMTVLNSKVFKDYMGL